MGFNHRRQAALPEGHKDPNALQVLKESQLRIRSMALIHEKLYQTPDLAAVDFTDYMRSLIPYLFRSYRPYGAHISLKTDLAEVRLPMDAAIPCGLILNELVSNTLKHAFPTGQEGTIGIDLHMDAQARVTLRVSDNGVGFPLTMDFRKTKSLGLQLVTTLTEQLQGTVEMQNQDGTAFEVRFPS